MFLTIFSIGVAIGSLLVNRLLKGEVSARYVPVSALLLAGFMTDLAWAVGRFHPLGRDLGVLRFLSAPGAWRINLDLAALSVCGGVFVIPLYAILQTRSPVEQRSRVLAANNIVNAAVTVSAIVVSAVLLRLGVGIVGLVALMGLGTLAVALYACWLKPEAVIKPVVRTVLRTLYRVELRGLKHLPPPGRGAVIVANHVSYLDGLLLAAFLPGRPTFALHSQIAKVWWMQPLLPLFDAFPVDVTKAISAKAMIRAVQQGRTLVIFPEGRMTVTGALMKIFSGAAVIADKAGAPIVPVRVDGTQYTFVSHLKGKLRMRLFPKVRLTVLPSQYLELGEVKFGRKRWAIAAERLYDVMSGMMFATSDIDRTLFQALLDARRRHGGGAPVVEDVQRKPLSYGRLIVGARVLAKALEPLTAPGEAVGLMLPNVNPAVATFFALQAGGRVPAMLNYSAGPAQIEAACDAVKVSTVVTARAFVDQAKLQGVVSRLEASGRRLVWLEDLAGAIGLWAKLRGLLADRWAGLAPAHGQSADAPAVILFTSGTEGAPKGVALTHRNIVANCAQLAARVDFNPTDRVMNALPMFHAFGLTGGALLPIFSGVRTLLYPNPLHYSAVPAFAYDANATILFGSDTFLTGYARMAHPYDFRSVRYIFAGAERVRPETRAAYADKFGLRILEGYGATECAPVIAVNTPMHFKAGSVGQMLPGMEARLDPVPGIEGGGRLVVRGPNVMAGYYLADAPGVLQPPKGGWYDTGDIVDLDAEGVIVIRGRVKRFAKIGGEMVSLAAVEGYAAALWPQAQHAVVARPDPRKGEELVLFTTAPDSSSKPLQHWGRAHGVAELALPKVVRTLDAMPVLGTGKFDYAALNIMAAQLSPSAPLEPADQFSEEGVG